MGSRSLPPAHRLHKAAEFQSVTRFRCSVSGEFLQVYARPNQCEHARLGLVVAAKTERLAVRRNRVKRLLREAFRVQQQDLAGLDLVVRLRRPLAENDQVRMVRELGELMIQVQRCSG